MEVDRRTLRLDDSPKFISPLRLDPAWECGTAVIVHGFIVDARIDVQVGGVNVVRGFQARFPLPDGVKIPLPEPLVAGRPVRARQTVGDYSSRWSVAVIVRDHRTIFPSGLPRPRISPAPVYECGVRTGVANLLAGCDVWITADGEEIGRASGASTHQGLNLTRPYGEGEEVVAWASLCGDPSPPSLAGANISQAPPMPLPVPALLPVYEGGRQAVVTNVANGARLTLSRNGIAQPPNRSWGHRRTLTLDPPLAAGEILSVTQQLCREVPPSEPGTATVLDCSSLPAPDVDPVQRGDKVVRLNEFVSDARITVFVDGIKTGDGSGPLVELAEPVAPGSRVHVLQTLGGCVGRTVQALTAECVAPPLGSDPADLDLFPVGKTDYDDGETTLTSGGVHPVAGTIYYPADFDDELAPLNGDLVKQGRFPLAVLVHGRHLGTTSHLGYSYLQRRLARMGIIAMSVDCNESNTWGGWSDNILDRAELVVASLRHLRRLDNDGDSIFRDRVDFDRVALMGHSRGGDAVVLVPEIISVPGIVIRGVIALAPVNSDASSGRPYGHPFMTILPGSDGDVVDLDGAQFYDVASHNFFKSMVFAPFANHNFFNREWEEDDTGGGLPVMARIEHERILTAYGCAFFRAVLLHQTTLDSLQGKARPPDIDTGNVHLSFRKARQVTVDDHQDGNGIRINSMGVVTDQQGLRANEHRFSRTAAGRFNDSFCGRRTGMVAQATRPAGTFRSPFDRPRNLRGREIWIRAAEVYNGSNVPEGASGFHLGIEDEDGQVAWVHSDRVGGLPRPHHRRLFDLPRGFGDKTKTMLKTLRFPIGCFRSFLTQPDITRIVAIRLHIRRQDERALAFDDLQIVR